MPPLPEHILPQNNIVQYVHFPHPGQAPPGQTYHLPANSLAGTIGVGRTNPGGRSIGNHKRLLGVQPGGDGAVLYKTWRICAKDLMIARGYTRDTDPSTYPNADFQPIVAGMRRLRPACDELAAASAANNLQRIRDIDEAVVHLVKDCTKKLTNTLRSQNPAKGAPPPGQPGVPFAEIIVPGILVSTGIAAQFGLATAVPDVGLFPPNAPQDNAPPAPAQAQEAEILPAQAQAHDINPAPDPAPEINLAQVEEAEIIPAQAPAHDINPAPDPAPEINLAQAEEAEIIPAQAPAHDINPAPDPAPEINLAQAEEAEIIPAQGQEAEILAAQGPAPDINEAPAAVPRFPPAPPLPPRPEINPAPAPLPPAGAQNAGQAINPGPAELPGVPENAPQAIDAAQAPFAHAPPVADPAPGQNVQALPANPRMPNHMPTG